jgi:uncharacterized membrane protein YbhN (UPF0104 family)
MLAGKPWIVAAIKLSVSAALLTYVIRNIDGSALDGIGGLFRNHLSAFVILLFATNFLLGALRWMRLLEAAGTGARFADALSLNWMGQFFNQLLPTSFGGDVVRAWYARDNTTDLVRAAAIVLSDRVIGLCGLVLLIAISLPFIESLPDAGRRDGQIWLVAAVCALGATGFIAGARFFARFRALTMLEASSRLVREALRKPSRAAAVAAMTLSAHLLSGVAGYMLITASGGDTPALRCILLFLTGLLVSTIPISFAGWGIREASLVYFLSDVGVSADVAFKASIMFGLLLALASLPGALFWALRVRPAGSQP